MNPDETARLAELLSKVPGFRGVDVKDVRRLVELLRESPEIGSIEVKGLFGTGVVVTRTLSGAVPMPTAVPMPAPQMTPAAAAGPAAAAPSPLKEIKSPMVGTFYASPEPGAEAYIRVGQRVTTGQTVCIVEAMKIMNEIEAELSGVIREVCVEDATPVEYGQVLFRVDPNG
ncbi:MAG TPA: acetyl-CoA carboxylase biotin carboxyl carrier protein [Gemmatimonadales bacterium]|nr:acetyl-CoA carboxylase biotin carboxyl carrier protein [Gemmatimonadales bacterium]